MMRIFAGCRTLALASILLAPLAWTGRVMADFTYLALGDSLAFGVGADDSTADVSNGDRGYVGAFANVLAARNGGVRPNLVDLGVSGETTSSFFQGGTGLNGPNAAVRNTNYGSPPVSQNSLLLTTIASQAAAGHTISTVTIQLGANDLYQVVGSPGFFGLPPDQQQALFLQALATIQSNDTTLLTELKTLLPHAQLILMGYYDPYAPFLNDPSSPFFGVAQAAHTAIPALNQVIAGEAAAFGGVYVDEYTAIVGNELADTYVASGNSHPNAAGYSAITNQIVAATVPEPGSMVLTALGLGAVGLFGSSRRRRGLASV